MKRALLGVVVTLVTSTISLAQGPEPADPQTCAARLPDMLPDATKSTTSCCALQDATCCALQDATCGADGAPPRIWMGADYLMWWIRKAPLPVPLVTTGPETDPFPGQLNQPNTVPLFGGNGLEYGLFAGLPLSGGVWIDADSRFGVQGGWFQLESRSVLYHATGGANGRLLLAEPFTDALSGNANAYTVSQHFFDPAKDFNLTGDLTIASTTRLWNWDVNSVLNLVRNETWSFQLLAGYRRLSLRETLSNDTQSTSLIAGTVTNLFAGNLINPPFSVFTEDRFVTTNRFNGGQIGGQLDYHWGLITLDLVGKLGLGVMNEVVTINGLTWTNAPLPSQVALGGIYAQQSNIGRLSRNPFTVVPEMNGNVGIDLTSWLRARVGYTFLYASSVVRPGNQIDPVINRNLVPIDSLYGTPGGPVRPAIPFRENTFWAQGINFGLEAAF